MSELRRDNSDLLAVENSMLDGLGQLADYFGFSKVMGQLYGVLLLSREPLSLDDLMERLGISKASVSTNMRSLEHMGMVRQAWVRGRGDRRKYYEAEIDFGQMIATTLSGREMRDVERALAVLEGNMTRLQESLPSMSSADAERAQLYIERTVQVQAMFRFARSIINMVVSFVADLDLEDIAEIEMPS